MAFATCSRGSLLVPQKLKKKKAVHVIKISSDQLHGSDVCIKIYVLGHKNSIELYFSMVENVRCLTHNWDQLTPKTFWPTPKTRTHATHVSHVPTQPVQFSILHKYSSLTRLLTQLLLWNFVGLKIAYKC